MAKKELDLNIANLSDKDLITLKNTLIIKEGEIEDAYTDDIAELSKDEDFDPYSRKGERMIKKAAKKYMEDIRGLDYMFEVVEKEIAKREKYNEEQRYSGKGTFSYKNQTEDEFFESEEMKTMSYRSKIDE